MNYKNKKKIFSEIRDYIYHNIVDDIYEVKISSLKNYKLITEEMKSLKVIELDNLEDFTSYLNYDHFIIFKLKEDYYFCDTELSTAYQKNSMIKMIDFNHHLRKDKIQQINNTN